jgi:chemotaxis protein MotA
MGLILALKRLENPVEMAEGIAGAFTATVTGIVSSYLLFGPFGHKMKAKAKDIIKSREMILEGIIGIALSKNPRMLREQLMIYTGKNKVNNG